MELSKPKQYLHIRGKSILQHTIKAVENSGVADHILIVIKREHEELFKQSTSKNYQYVFGGEERQDSVRIGLEHLSSGEFSHVLIHDAARPDASPDLFRRVRAHLNEHSAVIPAITIRETVKTVASEDYVKNTIPRENLRLAQTPQGFHFDVIFAAHHQLSSQKFTDDSSLLEAMGIPVKIIAGEEKNLKITTMTDLQPLEESPSIKVGQGFDVHAFAPPRAANARPLVICGVEIPYERGIIAHSDGDVGLHTLVDAMLGAGAMGDIGEHFPPSNPEWMGVNSEIFVKAALKMLSEKQYRIANADITIICEAPKISAFKAMMRTKVAQMLNVAEDQVNIKATTTEGLGFPGRGEGIAAQAVVLLRC